MSENSQCALCPDTHDKCTCGCLYGNELRGASKEGLETTVATESAPEGASVDPATKIEAKEANGQQDWH